MKNIHDADSIGKALRGRKTGSGWLCRCPAHDDRTPSLSVTDKDGRVLVHCLTGCRQDAVIDALRAKGLWSGAASRFAVDPAERAAERARDKQARECKIASAVAIWRESVPIFGTLAERYLKGRGINTVPAPDSLRYHHGLWHPSGRTLPAMVALIRDVDGKPLGISRTFLDEKTGGKTGLEPKRMFLGAISGGAVRLREWHPGEALLIGEGLETVLSVIQATGLPGWAALSTSGVRGIQLPSTVRNVTILIDADPPGEVAAAVLAARLVREDRCVKLARPPCGCNDFNDVILRRAAA